MTSDLGPKSWGEIFSNLKIEVRAVENRGYVISKEKFQKNSKLAAISLRIKNHFV